MQKECLAAKGIAVAPYREVQTASLEELEAVGRQFGYPFMLKAKTEAYDGRGNYKVTSQDDLPAAVEYLADRPLYVEKYAAFAKVRLCICYVKSLAKCLFGRWISIFVPTEKHLQTKVQYYD